MNVDSFKALLYKDIKDLRYNGQLLVLIFFPLMFVIAFFLLQSNVPLNILLMITLLLLPIHIQGNLLAEEKEQRTWRVLKQMGMHFYHLTIAKAFITISVTLLTIVVTTLLQGQTIFYTAMASLFTVPCIVIMICAGTLLGTYANNTVEVNLFGTPIVIFFIALEIITRFLSNIGLHSLANLMPNILFISGIDLIESGQIGAAFTSYFLLLVIWAVVAVIATRLLIKRKAFTV
ncbi:hypothetical protein [Shouchella clausii]|uniref:hypothetical protein n=1 Tax=Shouchella clausii TaxID=79880 RepID=UPI000BA51B23|nr:hypothetical protein [Shouchella clausii]PAD14965.1 hypothetical protein CHH73_16505 [Shouchella clausii]